MLVKYKNNFNLIKKYNYYVTVGMWETRPAAMGNGVFHISNFKRKTVAVKLFIPESGLLVMLSIKMPYSGLA